MLHLLNPQTGEDTVPPVKFLPATRQLLARF